MWLSISNKLPSTCCQPVAVERDALRRWPGPSPRALLLLRRSIGGRPTAEISLKESYIILRLARTVLGYPVALRSCVVCNQLVLLTVIPTSCNGRRLQYLWRRICRKIWGQGQSGQAIKLFQITPNVNDFQTFNNRGSWQNVGASKNVYLPFLTQAFHTWCETCRVSQQQQQF